VYDCISAGGRGGRRERAMCENFSLRVSIIMGMSAHVYFYFGYISLIY